MPDDPKAPRACACGCGQEFVPRRKGQKYVSTDHRLAHYRATRPAVRLTPARVRRLTELVVSQVVDEIAELARRGEL